MQSNVNAYKTLMLCLEPKPNICTTNLMVRRIHVNNSNFLNQGDNVAYKGDQMLSLKNVTYKQITVTEQDNLKIQGRRLSRYIPIAWDAAYSCYYCNRKVDTDNYNEVKLTVAVAVGKTISKTYSFHIQR